MVVKIKWFSALSEPSVVGLLLMDLEINHRELRGHREKRIE